MKLPRNLQYQGSMGTLPACYVNFFWSNGPLLYFVIRCGITIYFQFLRDIEEELATVQLTEEDLKRKLETSPYTSIYQRGTVQSV